MRRVCELHVKTYVRDRSIDRKECRVIFVHHERGFTTRAVKRIDADVNVADNVRVAKRDVGILASLGEPRRTRVHGQG